MANLPVTQVTLERWLKVCVMMPPRSQSTALIGARLAPNTE